MDEPICTGYDLNYLHLDAFLEMMSAERSASKNTLDSYKTDISSFLLYCHQHALEILKITKLDLNGYIQYLSSSLSSKSLARKISALRQFFQFLYTDGVASENYALNLALPKKSSHLPKALLEEQVQSLLDYSYQDTSASGIRTSTMLELLYATGLRISELITLKIQALQRIDIKQDMHYIIVKGKGRKERIVLLHSKAISALNSYLEIRNKEKFAKSDWLFPSITKNGTISHITRQRFGQILKEVAIRSGVDKTKVSPHKLRHSFATHMLKNGSSLVAIKELLGHSSISSTQIYIKISNDQTTKLVFEKHPLVHHNK